MKNPLLLAVFAASLAPAAHAAVLPGRLPALPAFPVSLPGVLTEAEVSLKPVVLPPLPSAPSLPSLPLPVQGPAALPAVRNPLPLPRTAILSAAAPRRPVLDWSFLDGGADATPELVPVEPAPKPLAPSGAALSLRDAADASRRDPREAGAFFDHSHPVHRLLVTLD